MKHFFKAGLLGVMAMVLVGCAPKSTPGMSVDLNQSIALAPGQTVQVNGQPLSLTFIEVSQDSRCAIGVTCIRAGEAVVNASVQQNGQSLGRFTFAIPPGGSNYTQDQIVAGYLIHLADVTPAPVAKQTINAADYRATFVISEQS